MKLLLSALAFILVLACKTEETTLTPDTMEDNSPVAEELPAVTDEEIEVNMPYTLKTGWVGLFEIGSTAEEIEELALMYDNVEIETIELPPGWMAAVTVDLTFNDSGKVIFQFYENDPCAFRVLITSSLFATEDGILIGSTYDDLLNAYSFNGAIWNPEGHAAVAIYEQRISFKLDHEEETMDDDFVLHVPGDAQVTEIVLW
ncbi:MAG: hypothetical protein KAH54_08670 [Candidatus Sabulitectum sp.]|nr:hypothetical protein [Candidatus Sabulitectum sp.]